MEVPVLIIKNLVYDVVLGTDTSRKIHAKIDYANKTLTCVVQNKLHTINLGYTQSNINQCEQNVSLQKPVFNLEDKIASNGQATDRKITADQQKQLNNSLDKHESIIKILAIKYALPNELKID